MRAFIVLCFVAVACADQLGYNYQPVGHSSAGLSFAPGGLGGGSLGGGIGDGSIGGIGGGLLSGGIGGGSLGGGIGGALLSGSIGGGSLGGGIGGGSLDGGIGGGSLGGGIGGALLSGSIGGGSLGGGIGGGSLGGGIGSGSIGGFGGGAGSSYSAPSEYSKEFYSYSAPEHEFNDPNAAQQISSALKQSLRVIFIKGPENKGLENAALSLARQAADQQTAIYVLNKQADIGDLANQLNAIRSNSNQRPEVHFVKYRTAQDAANAQHTIQSQYDSLGGSSQSHNGGVAPVLNFASQAPISAPIAHAPGNAYLPSSVIRHRF